MARPPIAHERLSVDGDGLIFYQLKRHFTDGTTHVSRSRASMRFAALVFNWCIERDLIADNPAAGIKPPAKEVSRERVLSLNELNDVLVAAQRIGYPWGPLVEMLVYTGQRLDEVAQATWDEFDLDTQIWSLPGARTKNRRAHVVHLAASVLKTISDLPSVDDQAWLFSTTGRGPVKGFSKAKTKLDKESGVTDWTFHDLRRTFATVTTENLRISPVVVDKVLNHVSGAVKGVAAVYERGEYLDQRKIAMDAWAEFLSTQVLGQATEVPYIHRDRISKR